MNCPYCGARMKDNGYVFEFGGKRREIFLRILRAGQRGVPSKTILHELNIRSPTTLRTHIHYINKMIAPMRVRSHGSWVRVEADPNAHVEPLALASSA